MTAFAASADRRFFWLAGLVLAAIVVASALGDVSGHIDLASGSSAEPIVIRSTLTEAPSGAAGAPGSVLRPLFATKLDERFPGLASFVAMERSIVADSQIISYYGNPYAEGMGIVGAVDADTLTWLLATHAARYDELNGPAGAVPAIHLVHAVAQPRPTANGLYLQYVANEDVQELIKLTYERDMLLFIDLQIGRSSVRDELAKVLPYLSFPNVHLALDPEFAVAEGEIPGDLLGSVSAADIEHAQVTLQRLVEERNLPTKLLMVHQFTDSMLTNGDAIRSLPGVELIISFDGFGTAESKRISYEQFANRSYASRGAIKLFPDHDADLMSEEDVLSLEPRPAVVIYQ